MNINYTPGEFIFTSGYVPSPDDQRDYKLADIGVASVAGAVAEITTSWKTPVYDQGPYGMCVAYSAASIIECIEHKQRGVAVPCSQGYIYGNRAGTDYRGEGMMPREALKNLTKFGVVRKELFPTVGTFDICNSGIAINAGKLQCEGIAQRPKGYVRLSTLEDIYTFITKFDIPCMVGVVINESFYNTPASGIVPAPAGNVLGGHAMQIVGIKRCYDGLRVILQNSWTASWGNGGFAYMNLNEYAGKYEIWGIVPEGADVLINRKETLLMTMGNNTVTVDDAVVVWPQGPIYYDNPQGVRKLMVPIREICEILGAKVSWYPMPDGKDMVLVQWAGELEKDKV